MTDVRPRMENSSHVPNDRRKRRRDSLIPQKQDPACPVVKRLSSETDEIQAAQAREAWLQLRLAPDMQRRAARNNADSPSGN